jgi:hypothetical protein
VATVLESLGRKRTSGVLEVDGNPAGAIYLDQGQITFARASWVPDLTARLCGALRPVPELRNLLRGSDQADRDIGTMLLQRGFMTENELQSILRSAVVDALIVLTMPLVGGSSVSDIRFEAPGAHWAAAFIRLPLEAVQSEVTRRADQMARVGVAHTVPVALTDLDRGPAFLTRDQWAIACRVNGTLTPRDLARQSGLSLYDTITALGTLLRRGLCTLDTPAAPVPREGSAHRPDASHRASAPAPASALVPALVPAPVSVPLPAEALILSGALASSGAASATAPAETGSTTMRTEAASSASAEPAAADQADQPRRSRGAHRADPVTWPPTTPSADPADSRPRPGTDSRPRSGTDSRPRPGTEEPRSQDPAEPPATLPYPRRPVLPQRDPDARLARPPNTTGSLPAAAHVWPSAPAGASESEAYASSGPDLLRRVLEGLHRLS